MCCLISLLFFVVVFLLVAGGYIPDELRWTTKTGLMAIVDWIPILMSFGGLVASEYTQISFDNDNTDVPIANQNQVFSLTGSTSIQRSVSTESDHGGGNSSANKHSQTSYMGKSNVLYLVIATLGKKDKASNDDNNDKKLLLSSLKGSRKSSEYNQIIKILLNHESIDLESQTAHRMNALLLSSNYNQLEIVKLLISKGANVNIASESDHQMPLHHAIYNKNYEITKVLLSDSNIKMCSFRRGIWD